MTFSVISMCLVSLVILVSSQNDGFAKQVRKYLPDDDYEKIFATNINSNDIVGEVDRANVKAIKVFENILNVKLDQSTIQQVRKGAIQLAEENKITPELIFQGYSETVENSLRQAGVLNDENASELAQQFAEALQEGAQYLSKDDNYETTIPALTGAVAKFFKSLGLNTKEFAELEQKNLLVALKKL